MLRPVVCLGPVVPTWPRSAGGKPPGTALDSEADRRHTVSSDPPGGEERFKHINAETGEINGLLFRCSIWNKPFVPEILNKTAKQCLIMLVCESVVCGQQVLFLLELYQHNERPPQISLFTLKAANSYNHNTRGPTDLVSTAGSFPFIYFIFVGKLN